MKTKITYTLLAFLFSFALHAQGLKRKMADDYFKAFEYYKAAPIYEEIANKSIKQNTNDYEVLKRTAESYYKINNFKKSSYWYAKIAENSSATEEDLLNYIKTLLYTNDYQKARDYINQHAGKYANYPFIEAYKSNLSLIEDLKKDSANFSITPANINSGFGEFSPTYYKDGIVFVSKKRSVGFVNGKYGWDGENYHNLYYSKNDKKGKPSKSSTLFDPAFNSTYHDGPITFNKSYDLAIFTRDDLQNPDKTTPSNLELYSITKDSRGKWSTPTAVSFNSKTYSVGHPSLSDDGKTLYFSSDMPGGYGQTDLWKSAWNGSDWGTPVNLGPKINSPGREMFPFIHSRGNLYFASDGWPGLGGLDLFVAYDIDKNTSIQNIGYPINTNMDDFALIVDPNEEFGYMSSNRPTGKKKSQDEAVDRIYSVKLSIPEFILNATVKNEVTNDKIENALVKLKNEKTGEVDTVQADENGEFSVKLKPHSQYSYTVIKENYDSVKSEVISTEGLHESQTFNNEVKLNTSGVSFKIKVLDSKTKQPLANATIKVKQQNTNKEVVVNTDGQGNAIVKAEKGNDYTLHVMLNDYTGQSINLSTNNLTTKVVEQVVELDFFAKKGDIITLQHIYYDYQKAKLRPESLIELDKLVTYLNDNPNTKVELRSHTDSRGPSLENLDLSQRRAQACVDYLISKGVKKENLIAKGYGEEMILNQCKNGVYCSDSEHQVNRRTEIKILSE
jgi:outer membrane protein OmpA-like peptidoglycan-associated protein/tetratricopeptide (TPR) repeat protein